MGVLEHVVERVHEVVHLLLAGDQRVKGAELGASASAKTVQVAHKEE